MVRLVRNIILRACKKMLLMNGYYSLDGQAHTSFSQMGEDLILDLIFRDKKKGFYVDVGAYHPKQYSNTYLFYLRGWNGINIDPMPGSMDEFTKIRPRDINLELGVGMSKNEKTYYIFDQPALSGFSTKLSKKRDTESEYRIVRKERIGMFPLKSILEQYMPKKHKIDFLSVDVEGMDYEVLASNDWTRFSPSVVVVEDLTFSLSKPKMSKIYLFLTERGYELVAKNDVSLIFKIKSK